MTDPAITGPGHQPAPPAEAAGDGTSADWRTGLDRALKDHPALSRFDDVGALAREHVHLQGLIGRKGVIPPTDRDPPEAWARFHEALGRPATPAGYEFQQPEGMEGYSAEFADWFRDRAHAHGLSARAARALHDDFVAHARDLGAAAERDRQRAAGDLARELEAEYGPRLPATLELARRALRTFGGEEALDLLEDRLGGPALVRLFAGIGQRLGEDGLTGGRGGAGGFAGGRDGALAKRRELHGDAAFMAAFLDRDHPGHKGAVARMDELTRAIAG